MTQTRLLHLIVKYDDRLAQGRKTIDEHCHVLKEQGAVWFGKVGAGIGKGTIASLMAQIAAGKPTYLFLFQRTERINLHRGRMVAVKQTMPAGEETIIPAYYTKCGLRHRMSLWIKLASLVRIKVDALADYHTASSGTKALHTASRSMGSVFVIAEGASKVDVV